MEFRMAAIDTRVGRGNAEEWLNVREMEGLVDDNAFE